MSTYLLIDFLIIILPLVVSFFPYLSYYKKFPYVLFSIFAGGLFFVSWDIIATMRGDWSFNPEYVMVLFTDPLGKKMLAVAVFMQILGALVIRKIVNIKV